MKIWQNKTDFTQSNGASPTLLDPAHDIGCEEMANVLAAIAYHPPSGPICRVYKCEGRSANDTGYCSAHVSPLRTGKAPYTPGAHPVVTKRPGTPV